MAASVLLRRTLAVLMIGITERKMVVLETMAEFGHTAEPLQPPPLPLLPHLVR